MSKNFEHLFHTFLAKLAFMQLFLKTFSGMANSVDTDQTAPLTWVYTVRIHHFVQNLQKHTGLTKAGRNCGVVIISSGHNSRILL